MDAILFKTLARNPAERYATAVEMQADLQRYLDERPVHAHLPSVAYRARKFLRRNAAVVGLSGLLLVTVIGGGLFAAAAARRTAIARETALRRGEFLESLLKSADPRTGRRDMSVAELLASAMATLDVKLANEPLVEASMLGLIADTDDGLGRYSEGLTASDRQLALLDDNDGSALEVGWALTSRGELLREQGRWTDTEPELRRAVALLKPLPAPAELAAAFDLLGITLFHSHQEKAAEAIWLEEIAMESRGDRQLQNRRRDP